MARPASTPSGGAADASAESKAARRRRLDEVFGDVLPETTSDERDPRSAADDEADDRWLRAQVPPHHG